MTSFALRSIAVGPVCEAADRRFLCPPAPGWTPLHIAAHKGHLACLEALLRAGAEKARGFGSAVFKLQRAWRGKERDTRGGRLRKKLLPIQSGKTESGRELLHAST